MAGGTTVASLTAMNCAFQNTHRRRSLTVRNIFLTVEIGGIRMATLTVTGKGQITLKQELLRHLNVTPGQKVEVEKLPDGRLIVGATPKTGSIENFIGSLEQKGGPRFTIAQIKRFTEEAWAGKR